MKGSFRVLSKDSFGMGSRRFWDLLGMFEGVLYGWVEGGFGIF